MAFTFQQYGTFTGTGTQFVYRDNDIFTNIFQDPTFNLTDVSMVLLNTQSDYVYLHLNGSSTANVTLEKNSGPIPSFEVKATNTTFTGSVVITSNCQVNGLLSCDSNITAVGNITSNSGGHVLSNKKNLPFDMPHPNKEGWRLRHVCIEGPEIAVYCRGKVSADGIINLPSFWDGLVNPEDMTINLTPIGCWQELFVKEILSGKQVVVVNNTEGLINADYYIVARRLDDDLIVEYEGKSHEDYPGGNEGYSFNFEHNYVKDLIQKTVEKHLDTTPSVVL